MRNFSYFFASAFLLFSLNAQAQTGWHKITDRSAGMEPVGVFSDNNGFVNVICAGLDANFNGMQDEGDIPPSWWRAKVDILSSDGVGIDKFIKIRDFEFGNITFPFRAGFIPEENKMYISHLGRIRCFNTDDGSLLEDTVAHINAVAVSASGDNLFLSIREGQSKNYVLVFNRLTHQVTDTVEADENVQQTLPLGDVGLVILSEGPYSGGGQSTVRLVMLRPEGDTLIKKLEVGTGANHLALVGEATIAVTLNGSHELKLIDPEQLSIAQTIKMPTSGYDGPRESLWLPNSNYIFTGAYNGKVYISSITEGKVVDSLESEGKVESLASVANLPIVVTANSFVKGSYNADSTVTVFSTITSVNENYPGTGLKAIFYPNPARDNANISVSFARPVEENIKAEIITTAGNSLGSFNIPSGGSAELSYNVNLQKFNLSSGAYYLRVSNGTETRLLPFTVVK